MMSGFSFLYKPVIRAGGTTIPGDYSMAGSDIPSNPTTEFVHTSDRRVLKVDQKLLKEFATSQVLAGKLVLLT